MYHAAQCCHETACWLLLQCQWVGQSGPSTPLSHQGQCMLKGLVLYELTGIAHTAATAAANLLLLLLLLVA